jgi:hypothetical protein
MWTMTALVQLGLFVEAFPGWSTRGPCDCGGTILERRTDNPFKDDWRCDTCTRFGNTSHSRVFGPRQAEVWRAEAGR